MKPYTPRSVSSPWQRVVAAAFFALCLGGALHGAVSSVQSVPPVINEFVANHAGLTDGHEYIEVRGAANTSYFGHVILSIDGDDSLAGVIDGVFPVTTTDASGYWWTGFLTESLGNGTMTLLLVSDFGGALGQDLDTDDAGSLDVTPWTAVVDAVAVYDDGAQDRTYTPVTLPPGFGGNAITPAPGGASRIPDGIETDTLADWALNDYDGAGLPGFTGALSAAEALNTPGSRNRKPTRLAVVRGGPGAGSVVSEPAGLNCGAICAASFSAYDPITLTAAAQAGSTFAGWSSPCAGSGPCSFVLTQPTTLTAVFTHSDYALTVSVQGSGSVSSDPAGITCGNDCSHRYTHGATVQLTATPAPGWSFKGWGGACTGTGVCSVFMDAAKAVAATFTLNTYALTVVKTGSGAVTSDPPGITCGADCTEDYDHGAVVALTATAETGWSFAGWGGACAGTGACSLSMTALKTVSATFTLNTYALTVVKTGSGVVTSDPPGITCGVDCAGNFAHGAVVALTATAETGWSFAGWGGACTGTGACSVGMTAPKAVAATFTPNTYALTVVKTGSGVVTSEPPGIACGGDCAEDYGHGALVALTATAETGWSFAGWGGACTGTGACSLNMTAARAVSAAFSAQPVEDRHGVYLPASRR